MNSLPPKNELEWEEGNYMLKSLYRVKNIKVNFVKTKKF